MLEECSTLQRDVAALADSSSRRMISDPASYVKDIAYRPCPVRRRSLVGSVKVAGWCVRWYCALPDVLYVEECSTLQRDIASLADSSSQKDDL